MLLVTLAVLGLELLALLALLVILFSKLVEWI